MSMKCDIDQEFDDLTSKQPEAKRDILVCKFGVYESLDWDGAATETALEMVKCGFELDGNMRTYLPEYK